MKKFPNPVDFIGYALGAGFFLLCLAAAITVVAAVAATVDLAYMGCYCG
jgi:hypothetical protein